MFLVNPRIVRRSSEESELLWTEQCLVLPPEFRATLLRDAIVTIEYETLECLDEGLGSCGETKQITLRGELARCAQHEMDHDNGILIVDHVSLDDLLSIDGVPFMAQIEDADGLHTKRMQRAYAREMSESTLISSDEKIMQLPMEDISGHQNRVMQDKNLFADNGDKQPWLVPPSNAFSQEDEMSFRAIETPGLPNEIQRSQSQPSTNTDVQKCDNDCLEERKRIVEQRRAMMKQARSDTKRADVLKLSKQRAGLYGTDFKGLPAPY